MKLTKEILENLGLVKGFVPAFHEWALKLDKPEYSLTAVNNHDIKGNDAVEIGINTDEKHFSGIITTVEEFETALKLCGVNKIIDKLVKFKQSYYKEKNRIHILKNDKSRTT